MMWEKTGRRWKKKYKKTNNYMEKKREDGMRYVWTIIAEAIENFI